jgi:hypothetical protein
MSEGKRSRCRKYVSRLVWYPPDTIDNAASTALRRISTTYDQLVLNLMHGVRTISPCPYCGFQPPNEISQNRVHMIQPSQDGYDIGAHICKLFGEYAGKEYSHSLTLSVLSNRQGMNSDLHQEHVHLPEHFLLGCISPPSQTVASFAPINQSGLGLSCDLFPVIFVPEDQVARLDSTRIVFAAESRDLASGERIPARTLPTSRFPHRPAHG